MSVKLACFIIHYTPLKARRQQIHQSKLTSHLPCSFVTEQDVKVDYKNVVCKMPLDEYSRVCQHQIRSISCYLEMHLAMIKKEINDPEEFIKRWPYLDLNIKKKKELEWTTRAYNVFSKKSRVLSEQHISAMRQFLNLNQSYSHCIFLEDDSLPLFSGNEMKNKINEMTDILKTTSKRIFIDLSDSLNLQYETIKNEISTFGIYKVLSGQTRCSSSYLMDRESIKEITKSKEIAYMPIDWHISYLLKTHEINTYWTKSPLFTQGSMTGRYQSNAVERATK